MDVVTQHPEVLKSGVQSIKIVAYQPAFGIIGDPEKRDPHTRQVRTEGEGGEKELRVAVMIPCAVCAARSAFRPPCLLLLLFRASPVNPLLPLPCLSLSFLVFAPSSAQSADHSMVFIVSRMLKKALALGTACLLPALLFSFYFPREPQN